jgi:hypothetical protein
MNLLQCWAIAKMIIIATTPPIIPPIKAPEDPSLDVGETSDPVGTGATGFTVGTGALGALGPDGT